MRTKLYGNVVLKHVALYFEVLSCGVDLVLLVASGFAVEDIDCGRPAICYQYG